MALKPNGKKGQQFQNNSDPRFSNIPANQGVQPNFGEYPESTNFFGDLEQQLQADLTRPIGAPSRGKPINPPNFVYPDNPGSFQPPQQTEYPVFTPNQQQNPNPMLTPKEVRQRQQTTNFGVAYGGDVNVPPQQPQNAPQGQGEIVGTGRGKKQKKAPKGNQMPQGYPPQPVPQQGGQSMYPQSYQQSPQSYPQNYSQNPQNYPPNYSQGGVPPKKKPPIFLFIILGIVVFIIGGFIVIGLIARGNSDDQKSLPPTPTPVETITPIETTDPIETPNPTPPDTEVTPSVTPTDDPLVEGLNYQNQMMGLGFQINQHLYKQEYADTVINYLKQHIPKDKKTFNIYTDPVSVDGLTFLTLDTGRSDSFKGIFRLVKFDIPGVTDIPQPEFEVDENGNVLVDATGNPIPWVDPEADKYIDVRAYMDDNYIEQVKQTILENLVAQEYELVAFEKIGYEIYGENIVIVIEYSYRTAKGIQNEITGLIPLGVNAITFSLSVDDKPINLDKNQIFYDILENLEISTERPEYKEYIPIEELLVNEQN